MPNLSAPDAAAPLASRAVPARDAARSGADRGRSRPAGLRWVNVERPSPNDRAWLEAEFGFHPLDFEDVFSRNQRPKLDTYDEYLFIVMQFPVFDKPARRLFAAELDLFVARTS